MKKWMSLILAAALAASLCVPAMAAGGTFEKVNTYTPGQFTDVPEDLWCADNVRTAYEYGIMGGKSETYFDTAGSLTVAQAVVMACRLHSGYAGDGAEFPAADPCQIPLLRRPSHRVGIFFRHVGERAGSGHFRPAC